MTLEERIAALRDCAFRIARCWRLASDLDAGLASMWASDALQVCDVLDRLDVPVTAESLARLQSAVACVASELRDRGGGDDLLDEWSRLAAPLIEDLRGRAEGSLDRTSLSHPGLVRQIAVVRTGEQVYDLFCSVCGSRAVRFSVEPGVLDGRPSLICQGIVWRHTFSLALADPVFALLDREDIAGTHGLLIEREANPEGVDAWCPCCGRLYCRLHYHCVDEYDDGFYDVTVGTCPEGHRRVIAD
jgi:hypothetical protein